MTRPDSEFHQERFPTGTLVDGKYRIVKLVGEGGMGAVFEAIHEPIGRKVAIKTLHAAYAGDPNVVQRFQREAQAAGSIGHDNICEVTDLGRSAQGVPYLVMPLLKGFPLSGLFDNSTPTELFRLADIVCQTLSALQAAHDAGIVHRDLKPDNIFVSRFGDRDDFVKLLDFGISKIMDSDSVSSLTQTGTVLGTPFYMAPEQAKGAKDIDQRVDIYAMGVILYEGLTGRRPFFGDSYNEVMFKIIAEPYAAPRTVNPAIPPEVEHVILAAMARDPAERYSHASVMRDELKMAAFGGSVPAGKPITAAATAVVQSGPFTPTNLNEIATPSPNTHQATVSTPPPSPSLSSVDSGVGSSISSPFGSAPPDELMAIDGGNRRRTVGIAIGVLVAVIAAVAGFTLLLGEPEPPLPEVIPIADPPALPIGATSPGAVSIEALEADSDAPRLDARVPGSADGAKTTTAEKQQVSSPKKRKSKARSTAPNSKGAAAPQRMLVIEEKKAQAPAASSPNAPKNGSVKGRNRTAIDRSWDEE